MLLRIQQELQVAERRCDPPIEVAWSVKIVACMHECMYVQIRGRGPRHRPGSTMHPQELTDGIEHVMIESQSHADSLSF